MKHENIETIRLFIAIPLPHPVKAKLASLQKEFTTLKWIKPENQHLTIRFLGQIFKDNVDNISNSLQAIKFDSFTLNLIGLGLFQRRNNGILWLGIKKEPVLYALKDLIDEKLRSIDLDIKNESFTPHITLSRLKTTVNEGLKETVQKRKNEIFGNFVVNKFVLYQSTLTPNGPLYSVVQEYNAQNS